MKPFEVYHLPLSPDYVRSWGVVEAVREILQNALDSHSQMEWHFDASTMHIRSPGVTLSPRTLLLGNTSKEKQDKIGSFGEGFKLALLVLCREGRPVTVRNGNKVWMTSFEYVKKFDANMLTITEIPNNEPDAGLIFEIHDLDGSEKSTIVNNCLDLQDDLGGARAPTPYGSILLDSRHAGRLFVGGLWVCDTKFRYGYDVKPDQITLERDRQTVDGFDLKWLTKNMWFGCEQLADDLPGLIDEDLPELEYANCGTPEVVRDACYRLFQKRNPGMVAVSSMKELEEMVARGMTNTVYVESSPMRGILVAHPDNRAVLVEAAMTPEKVLTKFYREYKGNMNRVISVAFKKLIEESKKWKQ